MQSCMRIRYNYLWDAQQLGISVPSSPDWNLIVSEFIWLLLPSPLPCILCDLPGISAEHSSEDEIVLLPSLSPDLNQEWKLTHFYCWHPKVELPASSPLVPAFSRAVLLRVASSLPVSATLSGISQIWIVQELPPPWLPTYRPSFQAELSGPSPGRDCYAAYLTGFGFQATSYVMLQYALSSHLTRL